MTDWKRFDDKTRAELVEIRDAARFRADEIYMGWPLETISQVVSDPDYRQARADWTDAQLALNYRVGTEGGGDGA